MLQGVLNDGYMVAIKKILDPARFKWACTLDTHLLVSKLQHKNIVKILGYVNHEVRTTPSLSVVWFFKRREAAQVIKTEYYWVEEYATNKSLDSVIHGMSLTPLIYTINFFVYQ